MLSRLLIVLALSALAGCAQSRFAAMAPKGPLRTPPAESVLAQADYGPPPSESASQAVEDVMAMILKDPESARYRFMDPRRGWFPLVDLDEREGPDQPYELGYVFGWTLEFGVNAKNSYGGYTGEKLYTAFFVGGSLRGVLQRGRYKDVNGHATWDLLIDGRVVGVPSGS